MIGAGSKKSRIEGPVLVLLHTLPRTINHLSGHAMPVTLLGHYRLRPLLPTYHHLLLTPLTHWTKLLCELRSNGIEDASARRGTNQLLASPRLRSIISSSTKENGRAPWCRSLSVDEKERRGFQGIAVRLPIHQDVPVVPIFSYCSSLQYAHCSFLCRMRFESESFVSQLSSLSC